MLPRSSTNRRSGRGRASWARRRAEPVATVGTGRQRGQRGADERVARLAPLGHRGEHQPRRPCTEGRSLAEWTARSARPSSTACCTSFTNTPWPPMALIGASVRGVAGRLAPSPARRAPPDPPAEQRRHVLGLPARQRAGAGGDPQDGGAHGACRAGQERSNRSRSASALRSPRGVPAASLQAHRRARGAAWRRRRG